MSDETALLIADVFEAAGALRRLGEETAAAEGLTQARWQVLSAVSEDPLTVPQAARRLGVSRQNIQRVANDLVALQFAAYAANPDHRGSPLLTLTPRGEESLARVTARAENIHRTLFAAIPDEEVRATRASLRRLLAELDRHEGTAGKR
ncbi:winged helix-turn-helix transcriptional regulator [Streptomyces sp. 5-8]|uniref:Winged helix-turn-helix transcriptional regulator n=1 Tax=Streptomyces musisoli TaxID=2802280 RepID=A0ABS1NWV1_9ACTN|nr:MULTISPECIES: MarR family winged helix-turn-helix transcriptional regulator [Streptomyces]MBL1104489.1 winged helix-turn-helix transcriptional regulator [Streptomyces musisoli]